MFDRPGFDGKKHNKGFRRAAAAVLAALLLVTVIRADAVSAHAAEEERITFKVDDEDGREYIDRGWWELYDVYVNEPLTYYVEMYTGGRYPVETVTTYTKTGATAVFRCSENMYGDSQNLLMKAGDTCTATAVFSEPNNTLKPGEHLGFNVQIQGEKAVRGGDLFDLFIGFRVCIRQEVGEIVTRDDGSRYFSETSIDKETWMKTAEGAEDVKSDFDHPTASGYLEVTVAAPQRYSGAKEPYGYRAVLRWSSERL